MGVGASGTRRNAGGPFQPPHPKLPSLRQPHPSPRLTGTPFPLPSPLHPADPRTNEKAGREVLSLKAYVFRALRYLFSVERNRKVRGVGLGRVGVCATVWVCRADGPAIGATSPRPPSPCRTLAFRLCGTCLRCTQPTPAACAGTLTGSHVS